jgi:hypothetical protein
VIDMRILGVQMAPRVINEDDMVGWCLSGVASSAHA